MIKSLIYYNWKIITTGLKKIFWIFLNSNSYRTYKIYRNIKFQLFNSGDIAAILFLNSHLVKFNKGWEYDTFKFLDENLEAGNIVLDIGANIGVHAIFMAKKVGITGKVYSFEPNKRIATLLKNNCKINNIQNITLTEKALGDKAGIFNLTIPDLIQSGNQVGDAWGYVTEKSSEGIFLDKVEVITLDSFVEFNKIQRVDFIKIDIEGAELNCFKGAVNTLKKHKPKIIFESFEEYQNRFDYSTVDLLLFLKSLGYQFKQLDLYQWIAY